MNKILNIFLLALLLLGSCKAGSESKQQEMDVIPFVESYVQVSAENPHYFQLSNGEPYLPIGSNICWGSNIEMVEKYLRALSANGGNFARIWLAHGMFDYETTYGKVDQWNITQVDKVLEIAAECNLKIKMCIEDCRTIKADWGGNNVRISYHVDNGGLFNNMNEYLTTSLGDSVFLNRVQFFKDRYGDTPQVFAWELWNEMNAVNINRTEDIIPWNQKMLPKVKIIFPKNIVTQSLGSMDRDWCFPFYEAISAIPKNEIVQVHRYLDEGAPLAICQAPVDILAADAVETMRTYGLNKPILLAETGAVKPNHTGPHEAYSADTVGAILHDLLFAPFFSGAAGPGHAWHWDNYIDKNNLWYHFQRFSNMMKDVNPIQENFVPLRMDQEECRIYVLKGNASLLIWFRDANNSWKSEFVNQIQPTTIKNLNFDLTKIIPGVKVEKVQSYQPWTDKWTNLDTVENVIVPDFTRSIVLKVEYKK